jgi:hypothetical protein
MVRLVSVFAKGLEAADIIDLAFELPCTPTTSKARHTDWIPPYRFSSRILKQKRKLRAEMVFGPLLTRRQN